MLRKNTRARTHTLVSCGELRMCTVLGLTPLALALRYRAKRLFLRPRSPLGREPLYLRGDEGTGGDRVDNQSTGPPFSLFLSFSPPRWLILSSSSASRLKRIDG